MTVRIKATRDQLIDCGIVDYEHLGVLLSGRMFSIHLFDHKNKRIEIYGFCSDEHAILSIPKEYCEIITGET